MTTEKFQLIETEKLVPYANNARTHGAEQVLMLRSSLREFGFVNPILVDANLNVIAGHGRLMAAKAEGYEKVPCVLVEHLTPAQIRAYILVDNRLAELADWDEEILQIELGALKEMDFDIAPFGFEDFKFEDTPPTEENFDETAELAKPAVAQVGDIWHLGRHKIICGDATKPETYERLLRGEKVQLVLTDPPYFVAEENNAGKILNDDLSDIDGRKFLDAAFANFKAAMARESSIYIFYATGKTRIFFDAFEDAGFRVGSGLVWVKDSAVPNYGDFNFRHEPIIYGWRRDGIHRWYGDRAQTTVLEFDRIKNSLTEGFGHPSSKPLPLISHLMSLSSKPGDKILDGFLGSATTLIAAEQLGRICFGIELEPKFIDVAVARFKLISGEKISFERGGESQSA